MSVVMLHEERETFLLFFIFIQYILMRYSMCSDIHILPFVQCAVLYLPGIASYFNIVQSNNS